MPFEDFVEFASDLGEALPFEDSTIKIFLDALCVCLATFDITNGPRTLQDFLDGLNGVMSFRLNEAQVLGNRDDAQEFFLLLTKHVLVYQHLYLAEHGHPLSTCSLDPPCRFH